MPELSWLALEAVHDAFFEVAAGLIDRGGEALPMLFAVATDDMGEVVDMKAVPVSVMRQFFSGPEGMTPFAAFLREAVTGANGAAEAFRADTGHDVRVWVQINEAWLAMLDDEDARQPMDRPDRVEALMISLHTPGLSVSVPHRIVGEPRRHVRRSPFPDEHTARQSFGLFSLNHDPRH